jgi:hypothetical protein
MRARTPFLIALCMVVTLVSFPSASGAPRNRHWVGVRERAGGLELFDRRTGDAFVPRGSNLLMKVPEGTGVASGLFRPHDWNPKKVDRELRSMTALGYDTVRVFIDLCNVDCISTANGRIRPAYARNIAAFLRMARDRGLVVMLASADVPDLRYSDRLPCCSPFGGYRNSLWLAPEGHDLLVEYWTEVVEALQREDAPLEVDHDPAGRGCGRRGAPPLHQIWSRPQTAEPTWPLLRQTAMVESTQPATRACRWRFAGAIPARW